MRIFCDVGGHNGQTLAEAVNPRWKFDQIWCFEPMHREFSELVDRFGDDQRVQLRNYGLSDSTGARPVYGSNDNCEASVFSSKVDVNASVVSDCHFVEASEVFVELPFTATIVVKMNCEGSEVPILNNLIDTGEIWKIDALTFDLDIRRVQGHEHEAEALLARLEDIKFTEYQISSEAFPAEASHQAKIAGWLERVLA